MAMTVDQAGHGQVATTVNDRPGVETRAPGHGAGLENPAGVDGHKSRFDRRTIAGDGEHRASGDQQVDVHNWLHLKLEMVYLWSLADRSDGPLYPK